MPSLWWHQFSHEPWNLASPRLPSSCLFRCVSFLKKQPGWHKENNLGFQCRDVIFTACVCEVVTKLLLKTPGQTWEGVGQPLLFFASALLQAPNSGKPHEVGWFSVVRDTPARPHTPRVWILSPESQHQRRTPPQLDHSRQKCPALRAIRSIEAPTAN